MALVLYQLIVTAALLPAALLLLASPAWRRGLAERLGLAPPAGARGEGELVWVHAASVGEVRAARPLVEGLLAARPAARVLVSTFTPSGRRVAEESIGSPGGRVRYTLAPLDWGWIPARVLRRERPALFVLLETELWPKLLGALGAAGIPVLLANGRLSERSLRRYRLLGGAMARVLAPVTVALVRTAEDAGRFRSLGVPAERVRVAGNLKHGPLPDAAAARRSAAVRERLGAGDGRVVVVAGSLRPGETRLVAGAARGLLEAVPGLLLVVAPRHPARFDRAELEGWPDPPALWSDTTGRLAPGVSLLLLDTIGELVDVYAAAAVACVGGTWARWGGHNVLEPALLGVPVLFGADCSSFAEEARALVAAGGGFEVATEVDLAARLRALLLDGESRRRAGERAAAVGRSFGGAVDRTVAAAVELLEGAAGAGEPRRRGSPGGRGGR